MGGLPVTVVSSGGMPVTDCEIGMPMTPTDMPGATPVTVVSSGGLPVTFIDDEFNRIPGGVWSPALLFTNGEDGAWLDPSDASTVYRDSALTTLSRLRGNVKGVQDKSGLGRDAKQTGNTSTLRYYQDDQYSTPYVRMAIGTDTLRMTFGASLGSSCTVVYANATSVEIRTGQTVGTTFDISKSFWQFLVINRALTALETSLVRSYFEAKCPAYVDTYDCYVDAVSGDDTNSGLTASAAKKTLSAAQTQLLALPSGSRLCVLPGTYSAGFPTYSSVNGLAGKTHHIHCPQSGVVIDLGETPGVGTASAFDVSGPATHVLNVWGDGNLTMQNIGNNAWGGSSGEGCLYDALIDNAFDGVTSHTTSTLKVRRVTIKNCGKGAIAHTGNVATTEHYQSIFVGKLGASLGVGLLGEKGVNFTFEDCDFLPDPATTTTWTAFFISASNANSGTGTTRVLRRCRLGAPHISPGTVGASSLWNTTVEDCYINGFDLGGQVDGATTTFSRNYGKWSIRPRRTATNVVLAENNVFKGGAASRSNRAIAGDVYSTPTDVFGTGTARNNIFVDCSTAIFATSNTTEFNAAWTLQNNLFHNNTLNYTVGLTADGTDVTGSNPLLVNPTTDEPQDWYVASNSPAVGAGVSGANIGIGVAS